MKIYPHLKFKHVLLAGAFIGLTAILPSCKVDNDNTPIPDVSALTIVNASPNSSGIDFYIDNQRVNTTAFTFPLRIPYQRVYAGKRNAKVTASTNPATLVSGDLDLLPNEYHSLFIVGKVEALEFLLIKDDLNYPQSGKTKLRFGNLSPDANAVSLEIVGDTTSFADKAYKTFTNFKTINPGKFTLLLKDNTTHETLATMENVELLADKVYTVWAKGLVTTTVADQKLGLHVINHDL